LVVTLRQAIASAFQYLPQQKDYIKIALKTISPLTKYKKSVNITDSKAVALLLK